MPSTAQSFDEGSKPLRLFPETKTSNRFELGDPLRIAQVELKSKSTQMFLESETGAEGNQIPCALPTGAKGTTVATRGDMKLVIFDAITWKAGCKKNVGIGFLPMGWIISDGLKSVKNLKREEYGDVCKAYSYLETAVQTPPEPFIFEDPPICATDTLIDISRKVKLASYAENVDPCLRENGPDRGGPLCSFRAIYQQATNCGRSKSQPIRCSKQECEKRLGRLACQNSPWKDKSLQERFKTLMSSAHYHGKKYGIEPRAIPCIAAVETGYLEPMAKNLMSCDDPVEHSYHGLGMITKTTLEHYLSPYIQNTVTGRDNQKRVVGPFRTTIPEFNKPSYYACPEKMHDALGASPELQIELMAYTLANKLSAAGGQASDPGSEYASYVHYNANGSIDQENGKPHSNNYADAVSACVKCLRSRIPDLANEGAKNKQNATHCLSATTRKNEGHPFALTTDAQIEKLFNGSMKRYCGEGGT